MDSLTVHVPEVVVSNSSADLKCSDKFVGILALLHRDSNPKISRGLFVNCYVTDSESNHDHVQVHVTDYFLGHYNLTTDSDLSFYICDNPPKLQSVVIGCHTRDSFERLGSDCLKLMTRPVLCRKGDLFLPYDVTSNDMVVIDCNPTCQGVIDKHTRLVVTRLEEPASLYKNNEVNLASKLQSMDSYLTLMNYTSRLMFRSSTSPASVLKSLALSSAALVVFNNFALNVRIEPKPIARKSSINSDPHSDVYVHKEIMSRVGNEGDWVHVRLSQNAPGSRSRSRHSSGPVRNDFDVSFDEDETQSRVAQIRTSVDCEAETAILSPQLWFNLNNHPSNLIQNHVTIVLKTGLSGTYPPYAEEIYLRVIHSPNYNSDSNFDAILKEYFGTVRYLCKGDVLALSTRDYSEYRECDDTGFNWPVVYFYVSRMEGPPVGHWKGYRVHFDQCRLYQFGVTQSYVPVTMSIYLSPNPMHDIWHSPQPTGLSWTVERMNKIILPFLASKKFREQVPANILLCGAPHSGKRLTVESSARNLNLQLFAISCQELVSDTPGTSEAKLKIIANRAILNAPCILLLKDIQVLLRDAQVEDPRTISIFCQTLSNSFRHVDHPIIVIGTCCTLSSVHQDILPVFLHTIQMDPPDERQRIEIVQTMLESVETTADFDIDKIAQRTQGFTIGDLNAMVESATQNAYSRIKTNEDEGEEFLCLAGVPIGQQDMVLSLDKILNAQATAIGAPKIPNVRWKDIGGLKSVKREILDTVQLPLDHPELLNAGLRRSGLLLHGPPGTGKTLLAKAVATECSLNFLSVKGPELINMYVGQSEENIREVFSRARRASPCIIFFDELDSLAPNRGRSGDSGGVMDRVVSQLLAELDGIHRAASVFVIGATNRPDLLDPALLRPGRFDRLVYVGLPETAEERLNIIKALTRKMCLSEDVDLSLIEQSSPPGLSGADFYALCSEAQTIAISRNIDQIEAQKAIAESCVATNPIFTLQEKETVARFIYEAMEI